MKEDVEKLADRLVMKLLGTAVESQSEALLEARKLRSKIENQRHAHRKDHVHILAYKFALQTAMESGKSWTDEEKDQLWVDSVDKAVAKLRAKGTVVEERHIPRLRQVVDLGRVDDVPRVEVRDAKSLEGFSPLLHDLPKDVWEAFHKVWTFSVGKEGYDKKIFQDLETRLLKMTREEPIAAGRRNDELLAFASSLASAGRPQEESRHDLWSMNDSRCRPPLPEAELESILRIAYLPKAAG